MRLLLEGPAIEPLLARVRDEHGSTARIVSAERVRSGGVAGFFAREHFEVTVEVDDHSPSPHPVRDHAEVPASTPASARDLGVPPARAVAPPSTGLDALVAAAEQAEQTQGAAIPPHRPLSTESTEFASVLQTLQRVSEPAAVTTPSAAASAESPAAIPFVPRRLTRQDAETAPHSFRDRLMATGLPAALLTTLPSDAGPAELLAVLRSLPTPPSPPARAGRLVAVVGERQHATATGRRMAERLTLNPANILLEPLASTDQARRASTAIRLGDVAGVVVVECGFEPDDAGRTVDLLRALSPDQVVACVDATRKTGDTRAWLDRLTAPGLHVDALSVHRAAATADPATVLALDAPVAEVDGLPGSATTWLALLLDRAER